MALLLPVSMLAMAGLNTRGGAEMAAWAANDSVKTATIDRKSVV